ncbi:A/G-specific adenine glycosylase [Flavobacteriales bacterium]|nr:A/G-specific adenine glycosylase [Flavobacteriales bacterium]
MDFSNTLIEWYQLNKRDLPWRNTTSAYHIWLSEIILQQTRIDQGLPYYLEFINTFPSIEKLASAKEDDILKLWQGLGYYSRARNLHYTAKEIVNNYNGKFPKDYNKLLELKGVGSYTAAAIASFAFNLPYAVVDGNVIRLLSRVFGIAIPFDTTKGKKQFQQLAQHLLIEQEAVVYNQAIMEFGALQCKPKSPNCSICPMQELCLAYHSRDINAFPVRSKKVKVKERFLHFLMIQTDNGICVGKRKLGIWKGLYEFPFLEFSDNLPDSQVIKSDGWKKLFGQHNLEIKLDSTNFTHQLSHQKIHAKFWKIKVNKFSIKGYPKVELKALEKYPVSRLMEKYLKTINTD